MINSSMADATIEMTIKRRGQETKLKDVANVQKGQSKVDLLKQDGSAFTLEKRDTIIFKGTVKAKDGKADYTTNPFRLRVR